jgi:AcrR family transcriptional regulator
LYASVVPKLWSDTIEEHRRDVRDAVLDAAAALVASGGMLSVTMSGLAEATGIGRATLYKYFPDVEAVLLAWHERQIARHLAHLAAIRDQHDDADRRLYAVLDGYAQLRHQGHGHHDSEMAASLHRGAHVTDAGDQLHELVRSLIADAAARGTVRADVPADELASYCLNALNSASSLTSKAATRRLVEVTVAGLRAHSDTDGS